MEGTKSPTFLTFLKILYQLILTLLNLTEINLTLPNLI
jgi:hypothetical protein